MGCTTSTNSLRAVQAQADLPNGNVKDSSTVLPLNGNASQENGAAAAASAAIDANGAAKGVAADSAAKSSSTNSSSSSSSSVSSTSSLPNAVNAETKKTAIGGDNLPAVKATGLNGADPSANIVSNGHTLGKLMSSLISLATQMVITRFVQVQCSAVQGSRFT